MTTLLRGRDRSSLRWRLVAVLVVLFVALSVGVGVVSTIALRAALLDGLDDRVAEAGGRALRPDEGPAGPGGRARGGRDGDGDGRRPGTLGIDARGQAAGTVSLEVRADGEVGDGGYIDEGGDLQDLTDAQATALGTVPADDRPRTLDLPDLGEFRVRAVTTDDGGTVVTGLATGEVTQTLSGHLVRQGLATGAGVAVAALVGGALVRRELRPLERVAATAGRVSELPLHQGEVARLERVPIADTDPGTEVGQVGAALNRLLDHVESALAARQDSETQVRQFVADASHELRTPLASIRGYAELVRRMPDAVPTDALRAMERVESESRRMTTLVEDMLLLARLDAGRPLERAEVDVTALAVDAVADAHAAGPGHVWRLDLPGSGGTPGSQGADAADADVVPALVLGDEDRLRQVLVNLLANARVHTPPGTTVVTSVGVDDGHVVVRVRDDGPGIPGGLASRLFHRFTRGDAARSPGSGSSGLGLAIVDAVVRAHVGTISVDGTPGATTFSVTLPAAGVASENAPGTSA